MVRFSTCGRVTPHQNSSSIHFKQCKKSWNTRSHVTTDAITHAQRGVCAQGVARASIHLCCSPQDKMSGFDNNPFAAPVDVNPFQVNNYWFIMCSVMSEMSQVVCAANLFGRYGVAWVRRWDWQAFSQSDFTVRLTSQSERLWWR